MGQSTIYVKPVGGLCNRIRVIDSFLTLANALNKRLVVVWEKNSSLNCKFSDLFEDIDDLPVVEAIAYRGLALPYFPTRLPKRSLGRLMWRLTRAQRRIGFSSFFDQLGTLVEPLRPITPNKYPSHTHFDHHVIDTLSGLRNDLQCNVNSFVSTCWRVTGSSTYEQNFKPTRLIADKVAKISKGFNEYTFGVHIRGTDAVTSKEYSKSTDFINLMHATVASHPDACFFLATDEEATKREIINRFGDRVRYYDQQSYGRNSPTNIQNALVDLLCLAETREVFGSYFSSFSQIASQWNGIPETTVLGQQAGQNVS